MTVKTAAALQADINDRIKPGFASQPVDVGRLLGDMLDSPPAILATQVSAVTTTTYTLLQADHNKIKDCTHVSGCTVTVPDGLTSGIAGVPFTCGLSKGDGGGDVTVVAGVGGAVEAPGGRLVMGDEFGLMTLTEWPDGSFRLYGGTA